MSKRVFVGGIDYNAHDSDLEMAMSHFGEVKDVKIIEDRDTGRSKGFGFVTFASEDDAQAALDVGEVKVLDRMARIDEAQERSGGGGRGSFNGKGGRGRRG